MALEARRISCGYSQRPVRRAEQDGRAETAERTERAEAAERGEHDARDEASEAVPGPDNGKTDEEAQDSLVVRDVNLTLEPGGIVCVLGPNGVGKTTLFKAILGFLPLASGEIRIEGKQLGELSRTEIARLIAYVPQRTSVPFSYTVEQFVLMGRAPHLRLLQQPGPDDRRIAREKLEMMGIEHLSRKLCTEISGGELQMACVARALAQEPRYLIMDEPTASLDFGNSARVLGQVLDLADAGIGVLMTTHDPSQPFSLSSDVVLLRRGEPSLTGRCDEILTERTLADAYGVDVLIREESFKGQSVTCCEAVVRDRAARHG